MSILLLQTKFEEFDGIGFYLISTEPGRKQKINDVDVFQDDDKLVVSPKFQDPDQCKFISLSRSNLVSLYRG
jgi:hypothetical protein